MISYSITDKKGEKREVINCMCYHLHYGQLDNYKEMDIYVPRDWMKRVENYRSGYGADTLSWGPFTSDDYKEYVRLLNTIGFKLSLVEEKDRFVFHVPLNKNKLVANKIILNAVRYLCEGNFPCIVEWFLKFAKEKNPGTNLYTKFIIAHYFGYMSNSNHSFIPNHVFTLPLSNDAVKKSVLGNNSNKTVLSVLPQCKKTYQEKVGDKYIDHANLFSKKFVEGVKFKDLLKEYKTLCAKYM